MYTDCDIYLHTGENCTQKKTLSASSMFPLIYPRGIQSTRHLVFPSLSDIVTYCLLAFGYYFGRSSEVVVTWVTSTLGTTFGVCKFVEVILCKWLPQFFF